MSGAQRSILGARVAECSKGQLPSSLKQRLEITHVGYQCVCNQGHMWIISQMWSIGF